MERFCCIIVLLLLKQLFYYTSILVALVSFVQSSYFVTEGGTVEVTINLLGAIDQIAVIRYVHFSKCYNVAIN